MHNVLQGGENSGAEAAARLVQLLKDPDLRRPLGEAGRETVRQKFLLSRNLEQYLDLFAAFETNFTLRPLPAPLLGAGPLGGRSAAARGPGERVYAPCRSPGGCASGGPGSSTA